MVLIVWICFTCLSVCLCVCVWDRRQKRAQHHTQGNIWLLPQLRLQPCIIPVTQPEIAPLWQFIYYSQASRFCPSVSVTHTHTHTWEEVFPTPLNTSVRIPCSILGCALTCAPCPDSALDLRFVPHADPLTRHRFLLSDCAASFFQWHPSSGLLAGFCSRGGPPHLKLRPPPLTL